MVKAARHEGSLLDGRITGDNWRRVILPYGLGKGF